MQSERLHDTSIDAVMPMPLCAEFQQHPLPLSSWYALYTTTQSVQHFISNLMKTSLRKFMSACICLLLAFSTFSQTSVPATALKFDPSLNILDQSRLNYVSVANPYRAFEKEITVEFWMFAPNNIPGATYANLPFGSLMGQGTSNVDQDWVWLMHPWDDGTMTFYVVYDGGTRTVNCNIRANEWHHYAATANATSTKFYVDGVLVHTGEGIPNNILSNPSSVIHMGKDVRYDTRRVENSDPWNRYATMTLDEVRIWSRALCQDEIKNNMNCELNPVIQNGLQQYYRFNQGVAGGNNTSITTLTDFSGNNRNGTLNNFTLNGANSNWVVSGSTNNGTCAAFVPASAPITGATNICVGTSTTLSNVNSGGKWVSSNTTVATINAATGQVSSVNSGTTTITYTTECGAISTMNLTVNPLPLAVISGTNTICTGNSTILTASGGATYAWNTGASSASITVSPTATTTYSVTATSAAGCSAPASRTVTVNNKPNVTASSNSPVNPGANLQLSASGAVTYTWSGPNGFSSSLQNPIINIPTSTASGTYTVTGTNGSGCTNTASVNVTVLSAPATALKTDGVDDYVEVVSPYKAFSKSITVEFWMNAPNAIMPYGSVMGQSTSGVDNMSTNVWLMHPDTEGNIEFLVNDGGTWREVRVPIKAGGWHHYVGVASEFGTKFYVDGVLEDSGPGISTGIVNNTNSILHIGKDPRHNTGRFGNFSIDEVRIWSRVLCAEEINNNKNCELAVTEQNDLQEYYRFNQGFVGANNSSITILNDQSGNNRNGSLIGFALSGNNSNWTQSGFTSTANCTPYVAPISPITGSTTLCTGASTTLANAISGGLWTSSNTSVVTINRNTGVVNALSTGSTIITYKTECGGVATTTVTVNAIPSVTIAAVGGTSVCPGNSVTLNATAPNGSTYQWFKDAVLINGASSASYNATTSGSYTSVATNAGCISSVSNAVVITITDVIKPTITCPPNQTLNLDATCQATLPDYRNLLTVNDNCTPAGSLIITQSPAAGSVVNDKGSMIVAFTVRDASGNESTCTITVNKRDITAPVITCTAPIVVNAPTNSCGAVVSFINPSATDNCTGGAFNFFSGNEPNEYLNSLEDYIQLYRDGSWNDLSNDRNNRSIVEFNDIRTTVYPGYALIGSYGGHTYYCSTTSAFWIPSRDAAQTIGGDLASINTSGESSFLANYLNTVVFDNAWVGGYQDKTVPGFQEPGNASQNFLGWKWVDGTQLGAGQITITQTAGLPSGSVFPVGVTTNTFIARDESGNESTCSFTVTVRDVQLPVISCPANISVTATSAAGAVVNYVTPVGSDNCAGATTQRIAGLASGSTFPLGTTTVTHRVTDAAGNIATCSFNITVLGLAPVIVSPGNQTVQSTSGTCGAIVNFTATETTGVPASTITYSIASGSNFSVGNTVVTATATNIIGSSSVQFTITVTDNERPVITCPDNQTLNLDASCNATLPDYRSMLTVSDNCTTAGSLVITQSPAAGSVVNGKGVQIVTFTVRDASGNESTCTISVEKKDITEPVITCPTPIIVNATTNTCGAVVNYINPTATDNCTGGAFNFFSEGEPNNYQGLNEDYIQLYNNGTWNDLPNSSLNRWIVEFNDIRSNVYSGYSLIGTHGGHTYYYSTASATWTSARSDAKYIGGDLASINTLAESSFLAPYGGNTWVGGYQDKTVPGFQEPGSASQNYRGWKWVDGTQLGAGQIVITQTAGLPAGSVFPVGVTTNTFTATDEAGNTSTCSFTVTVRDVQPPVINCPANMNATATSADGAVVNYVAPVGTDNCSGSVTERIAGPASGSIFPIGTTTVTYRVTDAAGLTTQCSFTVTVVGVAPVITCPANITVNAAAGTCAANVNFAATETVGIPASTITYTINGNPVVSGASFPVGTTTIVATATNAIGSSSCSFTVTVVDNQNPTITAPVDVQGNNTAGLCTGTVTLGTPVTADNCGVATIENDAPTIFPVGSTIVTWTVTDIHGNSATATQTVVIVDNEKPTITTSNVTVSNDQAKCSATIQIVQPATADNCGVLAVMGNRSDNELLTANYPVGTTTITWTVRDIHGNTNTSVQTIEVLDNERPVIVCVSNQTFCANTGGNTQYNIPVLTQSDNCGIASTYYTITGATNRSGSGVNASGSFDIGTSTVTYTVTDIHGNSSTCSFTVIIQPLPVASINVPSPDILCNKFTLTGASTLSGPFGYEWLYNGSIKASNQQLSLGLTDADGVYTLFVTDGNGCRSEFGVTYNYQKQNLSSSYTLLATKEVKLGKHNRVMSGSVGIMSSNGEAEFKHYTTVNGTGSFVKAPRIKTDKGVVISNKINGVATVLLPTMQFNTSSTRYLRDITVNQNQTTTLNGNYDEVTLKKGSNVTLTGSIFGKIKMEEGASVKFTSAIVNIEELRVDRGPKSGGYSYVRFIQATSVRVNDKVSIGNDVIVNPEAYNVTFFMGDQCKDGENFHVKGDDTRITANIYIPKGKIKVTGGNYGHDNNDDKRDGKFGSDDDDDGRNRCDHRAHSSKDCKHKGHNHHDCDHRAHGNNECRDEVYMTGLFIAEEIKSEGKYVNWNNFNCLAPLLPTTVLTSSTSTSKVISDAVVNQFDKKTNTEEELKVVIMPNPSRTYFTIKLESKYDAPVNLRVMDELGRIVDIKAKLGSNATVEIGHNYKTGSYFAEFIQGNRRKVVQLLKVR